MVVVSKPGPAPRGAFRSRRAPPKWVLLPPQTKIVPPPPPGEDCAPKKLTNSEFMEWKSRPETSKFVFPARIFVIFVDSHRIS